MLLPFFPHGVILTPEKLWPFHNDLRNLIPRSHVDEAEVDIWSRKKYMFFCFLIG